MKNGPQRLHDIGGLAVGEHSNPLRLPAGKFGYTEELRQLCISFSPGREERLAGGLDPPMATSGANRHAWAGGRRATRSQASCRARQWG